MTDAHIVASIDTESLTDRDQLIHDKIDALQNELRELSEYSYKTVYMNVGSIESIERTLRKLTDTVLKIDEKQLRSDDATRSFIATWFNMRRHEVDTFCPTSSSFCTN